MATTTTTIPTNNHKAPPPLVATNLPISPLDDPAVNAAALAGEKITTIDPKAADDVPPVPPLPASLSLTANGPFKMDAAPGAEAQTQTPAQNQRPVTAPANSHGHTYGNGNGNAYSYAQGSPTSLEGFGAVGAGTGSRKAGKERQRHVSRGDRRDGSPGARTVAGRGRMDIEALLAGIKVPTPVPSASRSSSPSAIGGGANAVGGASAGISLDGDKETERERRENWAVRCVSGIGRPPY